MKFLPLVASTIVAFASVPAIAAVGVPGSTIEYGITLDFAGNICGITGTEACGNGSRIGQNYGDEDGLLDVSHRSLNLNGTQYESFLKHWGTGYSGLAHVAWGGANAANYISEMVFTPATGMQVTMNSLVFGDYLNRNFGSSFTVTDVLTGSVLFSSGAFNPGTTPSEFSFASGLSSRNGLKLQWGPDSYDVGLGNVQLTVSSVTAVPEPETWAMLLAGLAVMGGAARRRRMR